MYDIDPNLFMNIVVLTIVATFLALFVTTLALAAYRGRSASPSRKMSYLFMFTFLTGLFTLAVAVLGFRGQDSTSRPWHIFLDMKYQGKYRPQAESPFFADGRAARLPPENTLPFDGPSAFADAGRHTVPDADFLKTDPRYFLGIANPDAKTTDATGVTTFNPPTWENNTVKDGYFVARIPEEAVKRAGNWEQLLKDGQRAYAVQCAVCHGSSGCGGGGPGEASKAAYGILGARGMPNIASYHQDRLREMPDGEIFNTIANGRNTMAAYGQQVKVQDRWAIVAYVRALQYAQMPNAK